MVNLGGTEFDPSIIADEKIRAQFELLLNLVETLFKENQELKAENQRLRDEINRLKGEQGKPDIKGKTRDVSSTNERAALRRKKKKRRKRKLKKATARTIDCRMDKTTLPPDVVFKGYETVVIPEIEVAVKYIAYRREKYYSPSTRKTYLAPLPEGYTGQFSPSVKSSVVILKHVLGATEATIKSYLNTLGCDISNATISRILTKNLTDLHQEKRDIVHAGIIGSPFVQTDDTMARVKGENHHAHIICNELFTAYYTEAKKDRLTVLDVLRLKRPRLYCVNDETVWLLEQMGFPEKRTRQLINYTRAAPYTETEFASILLEMFPNTNKHLVYRQRLTEAAYISGYHQEVDCAKILVCDDAPQFKQLTAFLALCWVHEGRHYKKLQPVIPYHRKQLEAFRKAFWEYYGKLLTFRERPSEIRVQRLADEFDALFNTHVTYADLKERMIKTQENKTQLLTVLSHPSVPLHNNASELGARSQVRKRDISLHTMSDEGTAASDTFLTIIQTAKKLDVNIIDYLHDRISKTFQMPPLADIIKQRAILSG